MASPSVPLDDFDNDDFDWEAAVREIDSACQSASASTPNHQDLALPTTAGAGACPKPAKTNGKGRQSTLDRFVDSFTKRRKAEEGFLRSKIQEQSATTDPGRMGDFAGGDEPAGVEIDLEAAKTWIYPVNVPLRDYQLSIAKSALFSNTLVALPTGLGKTLIAAVVMYNYFRWFPEGKIVFAAPSRPLVMQQIEACHNIVGIPQEWTIDMTGQMSPLKRLGFWKSKRVFFVTPQVLEKDIKSGICLVKQFVCLVIDEAHRATGNYSYCVAVRELMAVPVQLRILALTATPGSKQCAIQNVIDNLHISTLEYRNESDHDVSPYVHNRKLELIQVAMGEDAIGINNLLLEVIRPYIAQLCAIGVLHNRDYATLSPCELLNIRDKFRQAPPSSLPHAKYGEVEGYFGVLITLYHMRKLLSSHGIRPAYDMLEEKLHQGSFARLMSRNETVMKAKLLMQQSLSHGAPNPKLVKMLEILIDHFKTKDPQDSRVIIFSNFRGSVKDIMDSLSNIGDLVKATEFIGQSSGKALKGQSQKVQQAVLQKFRSGGYNVIVATSIGEEGLDIMEVDLVICFDANISPLRMIQRMGRTGRKHDGRVVVLACEGSELKGYLKKQASSKTIRKHMHNGGIKSFDFHPSPRMVPHICKPEVQFVELTIEQFIPRGRKAKGDATHRLPYLRQVSDKENGLLARYFLPSKEDAWRPSLIAFPNFQAFPSRVHKVRHSFRTTEMLIDVMQRLQGISFSKSKKAYLVEVETLSQSLAGVTTAQDNAEKDSTNVNSAIYNVPEALFQVKISNTEGSFREISESKNKLMPDVTTQKPSIHHFLFGGDFVTVNDVGSVFITSVPALTHKGPVVSNVMTNEKNRGLPSNMRSKAMSKASAVHDGILDMEFRDSAEVAGFTELRPTGNGRISGPNSPKYYAQKQHECKKCVLQTPVPKRDIANSEDGAAETPSDTENVIHASLVGESRGTLRDIELSPRLSHFIEDGIVPESPMVKINHCSSKVENIISGKFTPEYESAKVREKKDLMDVVSCSAILFSTPGKNESLIACPNSPDLQFSSSPSNKVSSLERRNLGNMQGSVHETEIRGNLLVSPINEETKTPLANQISNSSSENWQLDSGGASKSIGRAPKYRRLCKYRDKIKKLPCTNLKEKYNCSMTYNCGPSTKTNPEQMNCKKGKKKAKRSADFFIDEEAEVSQDAEVSEDEEDNENDDKYDDSFIDDRTNPAEASTQAETSGGNMMAFYRRSLLTQSPVEMLPRCFPTPHDSVSSRMAESGICSSKKLQSSLHTPRNVLQSANHSISRNSATCRLDSGQARPITLSGEASSIQKECSSKLECRKRKLSFQNTGSVAVGKFQLEHEAQLEYSGKVPPRCQPGSSENDKDPFCDDDFYRSLDLDAVEAQATELLRHRSGLSINGIPAPMPKRPVGIEDPGVNYLSSPSFDLGI